MNSTTPHHWSDPLPLLRPLTWAELETLLIDWAPQEENRREIPVCLGAIAKTAMFKPLEVVWGEILILTWAALDEQAALAPRKMLGGAAMT